MNNDSYNVEHNNEFDSSLLYSGNDFDNISSVQLYSEEMGDSTSSNIDYTSYFDDIINHFETLIAYDSSDSSSVSLDTIHHDLGIIITILLVFIAVFVGHGFVSKFRNL